MKRSFPLPIPALAAACLLGTSMALAQDPALPPVDTQGAVSFLSGGIGADEAAAIKAVAPGYPLALTFAQRLGGREVYLATVPVVIRNAGGQNVLETTTEGPYLLVNLPDGTYRVSATWNGVEKSETATVAVGKSRKLAFVWPGGATETEPSATSSQQAAVVEANLPPVNTQGGIPYLSGGVGSSESVAIKAAAARYSLSVTLARTLGGHDVYLATVPVKVIDKSGVTVLDLVTDGPFLLADLPPGDYKVIATYQGVEKQAAARIVAGKPSKVTLVWPPAPEPPAH